MQHAEDTLLFAQLTRGPSRGLEPALVNRLEKELRNQWQHWFLNPDKPPENREEIFGKWVELLGREELRGREECLDFLAQVLAEMPRKPVESLRNQLNRALVVLTQHQAPSAAARRRLAVAAGRENDFGWNMMVDLAVSGIPHTQAILASVLPQTVFKSVQVLERHQQVILNCQDLQAAQQAIRLLYVGPACDFPAAALADLAERNAAETIWWGVGQAAMARPCLQATLLRHLKTHPHPTLLPIVAWIAEWGAWSAYLPALELLGGKPATVDHTLETPPWSRNERLMVGALSAGQVAPEIPDILRRLAQAGSPATLDLLQEVVELPSLPLLGPVLLDICVQARSRRLLETTAGALLRERLAGWIPAPEDRLRVATRAEAVVTGVATSLTLARLGLPAGFDFWRKERQQLLGVAAVAEADQTIGFLLLPENPQVLQAVYEDATPNQRRLLLSRAPFGRFPQAVPIVCQWLRQGDPSALPAFFDRLITESPVGLEAALADLTGPSIPQPLREQVVATLGKIGGKPSLLLLGSLSGVDTTAARAAILARLGDQPEAGSLEIAEVGRLEVASSGELQLSTDANEASARPLLPEPARDPRRLLAPPPRRLSPMIYVSYLLLAPNRWGVVWTNLLVVAVVGFVVGPLRPQALLMSVLPLFINHFLCGTLKELRTLSQGVLSVATVQVNSYRPPGKNRSTVWRHRLELLGEDGKLHQHTIEDSSRRSELLDEKQEPVLVLGSSAAPQQVLSIDGLRLLQIEADGRFHLRWSACAWLLVMTVPWWPYFYDLVT